MHRVLTPDGKTIDILDMKNAEPTSGGGVTDNGSLATPISSAPENTISDANDGVKKEPKFLLKKDSAGRELSEEQQEYFKDSKVRDEDGNLMVVYHGTTTPGFMIFNGNINWYSDNKDTANSYAADSNGVYEEYLDIKKPFIVDAANEKWSRIPVESLPGEVIDRFDVSGISPFYEDGKEIYSLKETQRLSEKDMDDYLNTGNRRNKKKAEAVSRGEKIILTTDQEIVSYIHRAISGEKMPTVAYGRVGTRLADEVLKVSNEKIDVHGAYLELVASDLRHAYHDHLNAKEDGDIALTDKEFIQIFKYLDQYEMVLEVDKKADGRISIVLSSELENGKLIMVEVVSKSRNALQFKTIYGNTWVSMSRYIAKKEEVTRIPEGLMKQPDPCVTQLLLKIEYFMLMRMSRMNFKQKPTSLVRK